MITLLIRALVVMITAIWYALVAVAMAEVKLVRMGLVAIREWKSLPREKAWLNAGAGALSLVLPIIIIVAAASGGSGSPSQPPSGAGSSSLSSALSPPAATHHVARHHIAKTHHHRHKHRHHHQLPAWLRPHHRHHSATTTTASGCTLTSSGNCIRGGELCSSAAAGTYGYDGSGDRYICRNGHWEIP